MKQRKMSARALALPANVLLPGVLLIALSLRLARLTFQPLWADEGYSIYFASLDPNALLAATAADIHPPLYYFLLKLWMAFFGPGETALRLLSVSLGVMTVACTYALARRLAGQRIALVAALLVAVSPFHVYYSQEVRMYALAALFAVASTLLMVHALDVWQTAAAQRGRLASLSVCFLYVALTALSLYNLYYAAFVPVAQTLFVVVAYRRQRGVLARWLVLEAAVALLFLPWVLYASGALVSYVGGKVAVEKYSPLDPVRFIVQVLAALGMGVPSADRMPLALGSVSVIGLAAVAIRNAVQSRDASGISGRGRQGGAGDVIQGERLPAVQGWPALLLATLVAAPILLGYAVNLLWPFSPAGFQRLFICCLPFLMILAATGLGRLGHYAQEHGARLPAIAALAVVGLSAACAVAVLADFYTVPRYARSDYRPLVRDMATLANPEDVVIALYPWQLGFIHSYFSGQIPHLVFVDKAARWAADPAVMAQDLNQLGAEYGRVWFPSYEAAGRILETQVSSYLTTSAYPAWAQWYGDQRLLLFAAGAVRPEQKAGIVAAGTIYLDGLSTSLEPVEAGQGCVRVDLRWRELASFPKDAEVALRLADDADRTWVRRDSKPRNGLPLAAISAGEGQDDHHALAVPSTTPPGVYRLLFSVFDQTNGTALSLDDSAGRSLGNEVEIGKVIVSRSTYHPPVQALGIPHLAKVTFAGAPELIGYDVPSVLRPGHQVAMNLFWDEASPIVEDPVLFVQVRDRTNKIWGLYEGAPVAPQYPPSRWTPGEILRGQISFLLAPDAPGGEYSIVLGWMKGSQHERLPVVGGGDEATISRPTVVARTHVLTLPRPAYALDERLGGEVQFLGYDLDASKAQPGGSLTIRLYWRVLARMDVSYSVFVHLLDDQERIVAQRDMIPGNGDLPTTSWLPGEVISDTYQISLPGQLAPGTYGLVAGMYDATTDVRLPVRDNAGGPSSDVIDLAPVAVQ
jgi:hypothetical protein